MLDLCLQTATPAPPDSARFDAPELKLSFIAVDSLGFDDTTDWGTTFMPKIVVRRSAAVSSGIWSFDGPWVDYEIHDWAELEPGPMHVFEHELECGTYYWIQFVGVSASDMLLEKYGSISYKQTLKCQTQVCP
ncbi:hypothetical protein ES708_30358 [subsurface metagenome]